MDGYKDKDTKEIEFFYNEDGIKEDKEISCQKYGNLKTQLDLVGDFLRDKGVSLSIITPTSHNKYYKNVLNIKK
jgi:hypothetical protein